MENKEYLQTLVFAVQHGNDKSFEELYNLYYQRVYALALTTLKNADDAMDALQVTFTSAWLNLKNLKDTGAFNTWIQRIALNRCYNILAKKKSHITLEREDEAFAMEDDEPDIALPQQYAERADLNARLKSIINNLSEVQRQSVMLYYFSELSVEEIANVMGCSTGTVKSRLFLARKAIKTEIEEQERKSGQKFYGVAGIPMLPFAQIFAAQVKSTLISKTAAAAILKGVLQGVAGAAAKAAPAASTAAQATSATAQAAKHGGAAIGKTAQTVAKASLPVSKKAIAIITAATIALGGTVGGALYARHRRRMQAAQQTIAAPEQSADAEPRIKDISPDKQEQPEKDFFEQEIDLFSQVSGKYWTSNGKGGWTNVEIEADGSFSGGFGESNARYENGEYIATFSTFSGKFTKPKKVDEYTYCVELEGLKYDGNLNEESVDEETGEKRIFVDAYGIEGGTKFYFYLKGTPVQEVPEEYRESMSIVFSNYSSTDLSFNCLYNEDMQIGFTGG